MMPTAVRRAKNRIREILRMRMIVEVRGGLDSRRGGVFVIGLWVDLCVSRDSIASEGQGKDPSGDHYW